MIHHLPSLRQPTERRTRQPFFHDVNSAFDRGWHTGLLWKIELIGVPYHILKILAGCLLGRTFRVRVDGAVSELHSIRASIQ